MSENGARLSALVCLRPSAPTSKDVADKHHATPCLHFSRRRRGSKGTHYFRNAFLKSVLVRMYMTCRLPPRDGLGSNMFVFESELDISPERSGMRQWYQASDTAS